MYAASPDGQLAGFTPLDGEDATATVRLWPAARGVGRLVDKAGRPAGDVRLYYKMEVGPPDALAGRVTVRIQAGEDGRFTLHGLIPGSRCTLTAYTGPAGMREVKEFAVPGVREIVLGDVVLDAPR